jgi:hypothetical protein
MAAAEWPRQLDQPTSYPFRRLDTDTDHPGEQPHHRMRQAIRYRSRENGKGSEFEDKQI